MKERDGDVKTFVLYMDESNECLGKQALALLLLSSSSIGPPSCLGLASTGGSTLHPADEDRTEVARLLQPIIQSSCGHNAIPSQEALTTTLCPLLSPSTHPSHHLLPPRTGKGVVRGHGVQRGREKGTTQPTQDPLHFPSIKQQHATQNDAEPQQQQSGSSRPPPPHSHPQHGLPAARPVLLLLLLFLLLALLARRQALLLPHQTLLLLLLLLPLHPLPGPSSSSPTTTTRKEKKDLSPPSPLQTHAGRRRCPPPPPPRHHPRPHLPKHRASRPLLLLLLLLPRPPQQSQRTHPQAHLRGHYPTTPSPLLLRLLPLHLGGERTPGAGSSHSLDPARRPVHAGHVNHPLVSQ